MSRATMLTGRLPWPTPWNAIFNRTAPLLLEIGFGGGEFLIDLAKRRPDANIIGIEISLPSVRKVEHKVKVAGVDNVQLIMGSAETLLWTAFGKPMLDELYLNFSDPWPKHHHRRVINDTFLALAATRMLPDALLEIATDHADYAEAITACLERTPHFESRLSTTYVTEDLERIRTKYELKGLAEGRVCHYYKFRRNHAPTTHLFPVPRELAMPHQVIRTSLTVDSLNERFAPSHFAHSDVHVRLTNLYQASHDASLMVEAHITEPALSQRVGLTIRPRDEGELIISLHEIGFPRPSLGVHVALYALGKWIMGQDTEAELVRTNLAVGQEEAST